MKLFTAIVFCSLVVGVSSEGWFSFFKEAVQGLGLVGAYWDMRQANYQHSSRYFYARGNYDAAQRGPGGVAAQVISNAREYLQGLLHKLSFGSSSYDLEDLTSDQRAGEWGWSGNDPEHFRPADLPKEY
uniref:Serum amyloid A protein n=1 Tax=Equus asinus TaxID=9793 RepID=A0A9L0JJ81_EQUAS